MGGSPNSVSSLFREQLLTHTCLSKVYKSCCDKRKKQNKTKTWKWVCWDIAAHKKNNTEHLQHWRKSRTDRPCSAWHWCRIYRSWWCRLRPVGTKHSKSLQNRWVMCHRINQTSEVDNPNLTGISSPSLHINLCERWCLTSLLPHYPEKTCLTSNQYFTTFRVETF